jgi:hypothetical protein
MNATSERVCVRPGFPLYSNMAAKPVFISESQRSRFITTMPGKIIDKDSSYIFRKCVKFICLAMTVTEIAVMKQLKAYSLPEMLQNLFLFLPPTSKPKD